MGCAGRDGNHLGLIQGLADLRTEEDRNEDSTTQIINHCNPFIPEFLLSMNLDTFTIANRNVSQNKDNN